MLSEAKTRMLVNTGLDLKVPQRKDMEFIGEHAFDLSDSSPDYVIPYVTGAGLGSVQWHALWRWRKAPLWMWAEVRGSCVKIHSSSVKIHI